MLLHLQEIILVAGAQHFVVITAAVVMLNGVVVAAVAIKLQVLPFLVEAH